MKVIWNVITIKLQQVTTLLFAAMKLKDLKPWRTCHVETCDGYPETVRVQLYKSFCSCYFNFCKGFVDDGVKGQLCGMFESIENFSEFVNILTNEVALPSHFYHWTIDDKQNVCAVSSILHTPASFVMKYVGFHLNKDIQASINGVKIKTGKMSSAQEITNFLKCLHDWQPCEGITDASLYPVALGETGDCTIGGSAIRAKNCEAVIHGGKSCKACQETKKLLAKKKKKLKYCEVMKKFEDVRRQLEIERRNVRVIN